MISSMETLVEAKGRNISNRYETESRMGWEAAIRRNFQNRKQSFKIQVDLLVDSM